MSTARSTLRQDIARLLSPMGGMPIMLTGTPDGTLTTGGFDATTFNQFEDDFFNEWLLKFYAGTHKDTYREVTDFAKANGHFTFLPAVSGAIDGTDLFEVHDVNHAFRPEAYDSAINQAIARAAHVVLADKVDDSLVINDLLTDGLMEVWTSTSVLTNWTNGGAGTLARESTIKREGSYSGKLINTGSNAFWVYQSIGNFALYAGLKVSLYARAFTATADRVRIRLTDGVNTWNSDYHDGKGWRESQDDPYLSIEDVTIDEAATELTASFRIETGSQITAYVDRMFLESPIDIYEYTMPSGFVNLDCVFQETNDPGHFDRKAMDGRAWEILGSSTKKLWLNPNKVNLYPGRRLRLDGQQQPGTLSLDADTTDVSAAYIVQQALAYLQQARGDYKAMAAAQMQADRLLRETAVTPRGRRV